LEANQLWAEAAVCLDRYRALDASEPAALLHQFLLAEKVTGVATPESLLDELVRSYPDYLPGYDRRGEAHLLAGDLVAAEADFRRMVELSPEVPQGHFGLAEVFLDRSDFEAAREAAQTGLRQAPWDRRGFYLLGRALRGLGQLEEAEVALNRGSLASRAFVSDAWSDQLGEHAWTPGAALEQTRLARARGDLEQAARLAERATELDPGNVTAFQLLAVIELDRGRAESACAILQRALAQEEDNLETRLHLANCSIAAGQAQDALRHAERATVIGPRVARAHQMKGRALVSCCEERLPEARESFETALELAPVEPQIGRDLGYCCLRQGDLDCAQRVFGDLVAHRPWEVWGYLGLAQTAGLKGDIRAATEMLETATRLDPRHPGVVGMRRQLGLDRQ
jgi:tetratricopeptide (TPR) repeat protein